MKQLFFSLIVLFCVVFSLNAQTDKWVGGDISLLPSYEQYNTPYYDRSGKKIADLVTYAHDVCHWNSCRVRLFVNPCVTNADGTKQGEVQDLEYVKTLGKRIKDAGMAFMLDFHYSDTWADPVKQYIPTAWQALSEEQLLDTVYGYTKMCLEALVEAGATPDFVQVGNEVSYGMLWRGTPNNTTDAVHAYNDAKYDEELARWERFAAFLNNGARAVREVCPAAKIVVHIERTANKDMCVNYYKYLDRQHVDYDIIGISYYPFWHGWITQELKNTLVALHTAQPEKPIQIVETAYYNNYWPTDGSAKYSTNTIWPATPYGQACYILDLIEFLNDYPYVNGLYYWFPEENGNGGASWSADKIVITSWLNRGLFDPNSHKAYSGLYQLSQFIGIESGIENTSANHTTASKRMQDGVLLIERDGQLYNALGKRVR